MSGWGAALAAEPLEPAWAPALRAWALQRVGVPFQWGQVDCAILAFEAVDVQTCRRLAAIHRGKYGSMLGAMKYQLKTGIDLVSVLRAAGLREIPVSEAQFGDVICVPDGSFQCGHVVFGTRTLGVWPESPVGWCWTEMVAAQFGAVAYTVRPPVR